jgi:hypothetical protein
MAGVEMDTREDNGHAASVFHEHAEEYDSWYEDSLAFEIELAALRSLHTEMRSPGMEIGVGSGRLSREMGLEFGLDPAGKPLVLASRRGIALLSGLWRTIAGQRQNTRSDIPAVYLVLCS